MDVINEINVSSGNVNDEDIVEVTMKDTYVASSILSENVSMKLPSESVLLELNRNMTLAVLPVTIFIGFEAFLGLFGNIFILMIYSKKYKRSNFRCFVLSMAVMDLISCCTTLPGEIFSQLNWYNYQYGWICRIKSYFNVFTAWGSASILLLMAFDRYRKVCKTLAWQIQPSFARKLCGTSVVISSLVAVPIAILWGKQTYTLRGDTQNITVTICEKSGIYADSIYPFLYICCVYIIPIGIMVIVVCFLNIITAKSLFRRKSSMLFTDMNQSLSSMCTIAATIEIETELNATRSACTLNGVNLRENLDSRQSMCTNSNASDLPNIEHTVEFKDSKEDCAYTTPNDVFESQRVKQQTEASDKREHLKNVNDSFDMSYVQNILHTHKELVESRGRNSFKFTSSHCNKKELPKRAELRKKRKTIIMLILTSFFLITMSLYVILITFVAEKDGILKNSSNSAKVVFFFFWRLYFANTIVNPILYGVLDPRFRSGLRSLLQGRFRSKRTSHSASIVSVCSQRPVFTLH